MMAKSDTRPTGATSFKETSFGILSRGKLVKLELEGVKRGLKFIESLVKGKKTISITPELIKKLHQVSFGWIFPDWGGKFRTVQVRFSDKEAPPFFKVPELISNLCSDLKERLKHLPSKNSPDYIEKVVNLLAWFQHQFVFIHPFQDYNGRLSRLLTILLSLKLELPPSEIKASSNKDRKRYLNAMYAADGGDISLLEKIILETIKEGQRNV